MSIADNILDAVSILMDKKVSDLQFNKTVRAKISEVIDTSIGKYKVQYQNSYFTAYASDSNVRYQKNAGVYVEILSNNFEKNALIIGTVQKLGSNYITIIDKLDRYTEVGAQLNCNKNIELCSYTKKEIQLYSSTADSGYNQWDLDTNSVTQAVKLADALKIGVTIKNTLSNEQQSSGNFGIKVIATYYDPAFIEQNEDTRTIDRLYQFDINDMTGEPYKYVVPVEQYGIFNIDKENFKSIKSISVFNKDFPVQGTGKSTDIWFSDIHLQFLSEISENELQTSSLRITTPQGNFFTASNQAKELKADLRIKGKKVNYNTQNIDFYWFRENVNITASAKNFSPYGGNGWELLNPISLNTYKININYTQCSSANTKFKCVAVFTDNGTKISLNDIYTFKNINGSVPEFTITSSAGSSFSFSTGRTILTINGGVSTNTYTYQWARSIGGEALELISGATKKEYTVEIISPAAEYIIYKCSVFDNKGILKGTAEIALYNNKEQNGCTLVLKDGTQIFKYDGYGVSPASEAMAAADRMTIPALSFDIYDRQGNLINIPDAEKSKYMTIKWIWPAEYVENDLNAKYQTMLVPNTDLFTISHIDLTTGKSIVNYGVEGCPTFTYKIRDTYNAELANTDSARNNITLEVDYQGEHLVARTNFTFTKEGELGTNGTKYVARVVPKNPYEEIFIMGSSLYGIKRNSSSQSTANFTFVNLGTSEPINNIFEAQLWDGRNNVIASTSIKWAIASSTTRTNKQRLIINQNNDIIVKNGNYTFSNVLQAVITLNGIKYYATYPIIYTTGLKNNKMLYIADGYREVMYENDGTRGKFNGLPFVPKWFGGTGLENAARVNVNVWNSSWGAAAMQVENSFNKFTIEPPSYYNAEQTGHYIRLILDGITTYLPIELYLNRYGMSAMNDWDGNSVQVNSKGGYILSPQIGAGRKNDDNSFTGITIGEVFQDVNNKEIGMFGYYEGQRSLFLDAETGDAEFGIASEGQIKIRASDGQGTISDGHYHYDHTLNPKYQPDPSKPNYDPNRYLGKGMKIKFTSTPKDSSDSNDEQGPYIKYGTGNFMVDANGYITARGGGKIAGWEMDDDNLYSSNGQIYLNSSIPKIYGQTNSKDKHDALNSTTSGFYLASDGLSLGSNFRATSSGVVYIGDNASVGTSDKKYWEINGSTTTIDGEKVSNSYIKYRTSGNSDSVYLGTDKITLGSKFYVDSNGVTRIGAGAVGNTNKHWTIDASETIINNQKVYNSYIRYGDRNKANSVNIATNEITLGTKFYADDEGVVRIGAGAVSGTKNGKYWTIDADTNGESYIKYGTSGNSNSVYLSTDKLTIGSQFYVGAADGIVRVGNGAVAGNNGKYWTIDANGTNRSYISYKSTNAVPSIVNKNTNLDGTSNSVYLGTDGIRLGQKFGVDNEGNVKMDNLYANNSGVIGGWTIDSNKLSSQDGNTNLYADDNTKLQIGNTEKPIRLSIGANSDFKILKDGTLAGPPALAPYFTPSHTKWEITPNGVAYFTDVKIKNKTAGDNIFEWTGLDSQNRPQNIFKLTDTGSQIGGWNISGDSLSSGNINITSGVYGSKVNTVMSVGEAYKLYGNGDVILNTITSSGSGSFNGSLSGNTCTFTSGSIGGCYFNSSGVWTSQAQTNGISAAGYLVLGGENLGKHSIAAMTGLSNFKVEISETKEVSTTVYGSDFGFSGTPTTISITVGEDTGSTYYTPSGSISGSATVSVTVPSKLSISGTCIGKTYTLVGGSYWDGAQTTWDLQTAN